MKELKDRGILMTPANATAIDEGRKTMTRRIIKLREFGPTDTPGYDWTFRNSRLLWNDVSTERLLDKWCPYVVGQRLYLKEPHYAFGLWVPDGLTKTGRPAWRFRYTALETVFYFADTLPKSMAANLKRNTDRKEGWYERPAMFMFKEFARTWLKVTEVKAPERIQEISEEDCKAEGLTRCINQFAAKRSGYPQNSYKAGMYHLWNIIHGAGAWNKNEWVWVVTFEKIEKE